MKFPRLRNSASTTDIEDETEVVEETLPPGVTAKKGKPTPKRRQAEGRQRGPAAPPPKTQREAAKRQRGTKGDRKAAAAQRRQRMLPRDQGPVRAYVRDIVDSRRHLAGLFMPLALVVLIAIITPVPTVQAYAAPVTLVILLFMVIEGIWVGRDVNKRVRARFPDAPDGSLALGWYAFVRSSQVRRLRMPKPTVTVGAEVD
ncbi:MAG TPA: DUF3043 domain-containing protein [Pseudonocardiaceae bacterium]|nr:DUF3043 domain-containing protein [Pseudonocardiaceae bacterium]